MFNKTSKLTIVTILACLSLGGLTGCEIFLGANLTEKFPPPGRLVDINGRKLQIDCRGSGSPTVILEPGNGTYGSLSWLTMQDKVAASTRVCSYSRPGYMWSDSRLSALDVDGVANDLRTALRFVGEAPPFVMVSHSRGALLNLIFTDIYREDVAGLVFLDPRHPELKLRRAQAGIETSKDLPLMRAKILRSLRWTGLLRVIKPCNIPTLTTDVNNACNAFYPHSLDGYIYETKLVQAINTRAAEVDDLGDFPVVVLTRKKPVSSMSFDETERGIQLKREAHWRELNAEFASWSSRGEQRIIPDSNHNDLLVHQASVDAVMDVVDIVRRESFNKR